MTDTARGASGRRTPANPTAANPTAAIPTPGEARLQTVDARLGYDRRTVSEGISAAIPDGSFTVIVGPNACGKSTLLRSFSRLLKPTAGSVLLDGRDIASLPPKQVARTVGLLPQSSVAPDGITVVDLVRRGRYPHQGLIRQWSARDRIAVDEALEATDLTELAARPVAELSGGQRQRAWVAMALAQETPILLLDEPTTYLDISHQMDLLNLFARLHQQGTTIAAVLHDLNQAARYATHLIVMKEGRIVATGAPADVISAELIERVFELPCVVIADPVTGGPLVVPR
ncbi:ABC transporter ATP-binding protein [Naasia lichenicola]|uniref:ABC transporter ATP-binding protein n=1 Tax=Naasia lichenicola TaxID=2565933 RepID=A0A4S4FG89_9MICO|nr:ABC transporter ATP-binding protein [Naasia lichenicola]THG29249.1 ABC transporter ATP-binding protein [Naasia lichenicola]